MELFNGNAAHPFDNVNPPENLETAMVCVQALAKAKMDDKVRSFLIGKLCESFEGALTKDTTQNTHELDQTVNVPDEKGEGNNSTENASGTLQNLSSKDSQEKLLMFLNKALTHGALVLNDEDTLNRCLHDAEMVCSNEKGKENFQSHCVHEEVSFGGDCLKENTRKFKETAFKNEGERALQTVDKEPTVNAQGSLTEIATVKKDKVMSHLPGCLGLEGTICLCSHVSPCQQLTLFAGRKDKLEVHSPQVITFSDSPNRLIQKQVASVSVLANKGDKKETMPVTGSHSPISFLEAAKRSMRNNSSSPDSHHDQFSSSLLMGTEDSDMANDGGTRVVVPTETIRRRMEFCKLSIIGRVILAKGEEPWNTKKLREKLNEVWNFKSSWRLISLGKGFFHVLLTSQEEFEKVWIRGAINLKPGVMRFQKWSFGFDPTKEKSSKAQVWFRFYNLPWCLWDSSILTALSKKIGTPIRFDHNTINGDFGHFARVLIDVDLSKKIKEVLQLDCGKEIFDVKVVPENIPNFCNACSNIGHISSECRLIRRKVENEKVTKDCNDAKTELAIQDRLDSHRSKRKEISTSSIGGTSTSQGKVTVSDSSKCIPTSNHFSALEVFDVTEKRKDQEEIETRKENAPIHNRMSDEAKGEGSLHVAPLNIPCLPSEPQNSIKEIRKWVESSKWSDMVENDEKQKTAPRTSVPSSKSEQSDLVSSELNGELMQYDRKTGRIYFSPLPSKTNNSSS